MLTYSDRLKRYMLSLTGKAEPKVCFLPTAAGDAAEQIVTWYEVMSEFPCRPSHLRLFNASSQFKDPEKLLLSMDAIFVSGGNTVNMLAVWKAQKLDAVLKKAWESGVLISGESAGMICWFEQAVTDSRPEQYTTMDGLGWLKGSACAHYADPKRKELYREQVASGTLKEGVACEGAVALLYEGERLVKAVGHSERFRGYTVTRESGKAVEKPMPVEVLADKK